jgi:cysteine desulfurase
MLPEVLEAMLPYFTERFGNPSSVHAWGRAAHQGMENSRRQVAAVLGCRPREVVFTSGGTEADNFAMKGVAWAYRRGAFPAKQPSAGPGHVIISAIEHHAILHSAEDLEQHGFEVTVLPVDRQGMLDPDDVGRAVRADTILVSIMYANNEIGTVQPIKAIADIAHSQGALFHTDAVQAGGALDMDVQHLGADLLSLSAHKFYGPKGVGVLYVKANTPLLPIQHGGSQESRRRASTENVPGIVGLGAALHRAHQSMASEREYVQGLRDKLVSGIMGRIERVHFMGHTQNRLPNNANFCIEGVDGETMLLKLDMRGIGASSGAACASGSSEPSHVLRAIGVPRELAQGSLRLTVGIDNTPEDIEYALDVLEGCVADLRAGTVSAVAGTA